MTIYKLQLIYIDNYISIIEIYQFLIFTLTVVSVNSLFDGIVDRILILFYLDGEIKDAYEAVI